MVKIELKGKDIGNDDVSKLQYSEHGNGTSIRWSRLISSSSLMLIQIQ